MTLYHGDCLDVLPTLPAASVAAVVTDPEYGLNFMNMKWDSPGGAAFRRETWETIGRTMKPGGYLLAFGGTRTYHRLACAVEDAGFEIRDCVMWLYGSGFPKGKGCLKPAWEPVLLCRRPGKRVLPLGIEDCRVATVDGDDFGRSAARADGTVHPGLNGYGRANRTGHTQKTQAGRYPANVCHDGSDEVLEAFAAFGELSSHNTKRWNGTYPPRGTPAEMMPSSGRDIPAWCDTGTAARFYYCAKASRSERGEGNTHPTVKPLALCEWLVRLVARAGETVLDPFAGSGTTLLACEKTGRRWVGVEKDAGYVEIARRRLAAARNDAPLFAEAT